MTREELFAKSAEKRQGEKQREEQWKAGGGQDFQPIQYSALIPGGWLAARLLGNPINFREGDATSGKMIYFSMIVGDDDKKHRIIFPDRRENHNWLLWKVYNKVTEYKWNKVTNQRDYLHASKHPTVFGIVAKNGQVNNALETGWRPSRAVVINAIDRSRMDWHRENKHTVLLSKKASELPNGDYFYDLGVPPTLYDAIWDEVVAEHGDWQNYDVLMWKKMYIASEKTDNNTIWYKAKYAPQAMQELNDEQLKGMDLSRADEPLSEEELSWERYDMDTIFGVTSYNKIYRFLKIKLEQIDAAMGTNYLEELQDLKSMEDKEREAESNEDEPVKNETTKPQATGTDLPTEDKPKRSRARKSTVDLNALEESGYEGLSKLSAEEKKAITDYDPDTGKLSYSSDFGAVVACNNADADCDYEAPEGFSFCPKCGTKF